DVHAEAVLLEHTTSDDVADKLEPSMAYPAYCPHGGAIKIDLIDMQVDHNFTISVAEAGAEVVIPRIVDQEQLRQYYMNQHLNIGDRISVTDIDTSIDLITLTD